MTGETAPDAAQLDPEQIASLRRLRQGTLLPRLLVSYRERSGELIGAIEQAVGRADADALREAAHALKSASLTMGAVGVAQVCAGLEATAREGVTEGLGATLATLRARHATLLPQLEALCEERAP